LDNKVFKIGIIYAW